MAYPILMYHQIDASPPKGTPLRGLTVTPERFGRQMGLLRWMGYRGVSINELEPYLRGEKTGKVVGITFDDGYRNNLEHALPVLQRFKDRVDHRRFNGAALLGLRGLVFKSHGSADEIAFETALNRAYDAARNQLLDRVRHRIAHAAPLLSGAALASEAQAAPPT